MPRSSLLLLLLMLLAPVPAAAAPAATAQRDTARLGIPWTRYTTLDALGRTVTFYLSDVPDSLREAVRPLALVIEGSGGQSVWVRVGDRIGGSLQNLARRAARQRVRVLVVEKPGVAFLEQRERPGGAMGASEMFRREHTLERWAEANAAALRAVLAMPRIAASPVLVVGHSEGADVACRVAAVEPRVTHVASLAGAGASQLFDFLHRAAEPQPGDAAGAAEQRRQEVIAQWRAVQADPQSIDAMWLGHPHRRWTSFLAGNRLEDLQRSRARVFLAHGTADASVPVASADWLFAELLARGRDVRYDRLEGVDHGFQGAGASAEGGGLEGVMEQVLAWALAPTP